MIISTRVCSAMNVLKLLSLTVLLLLYSLGHASKVLELSDKFVEVRRDGSLWLVMFYAPWCGHCKRLEPVWAHVAQALACTNVRVGKVDCTRFTSVATEFGVSGFPTIKFVKGDLDYTFNGDRIRDDILAFAMRMSGPPVQQLTRADSMEAVRARNPLFFMYVGESGVKDVLQDSADSGSGDVEGGSGKETKELRKNSVESSGGSPLWHAYYAVAQRFQAHGSFYAARTEIARQHVDLSDDELPAVYVYKESLHYFYPVESGVNEWDIEHLNTTMYNWINEERFDTFPKITRGNLHQLVLTRKYLVLAIIEENKLNEIAPEMVEFRDIVESVIRKKRDKYHRNFQFGWVGNPELANSIAMTILPLPYLLVLNSTTNHHYVPEDDPSQLTPDAIDFFLERVLNQSIPIYGGDGLFTRLYRMYFEARTSMGDMWRGNPVLTTVLFGLPFGFLTLIIYSIFCSDIMDADEDEEESLLHEKRE